MDTGGNPSPAKELPAGHIEEDQGDVANRAVAFPDDNIREEKIRPKGVEMKRTITQDEKDLAAAGYEHLDATAKQRKLDEANLDIQEHKLPLDALSDTFKTSFNTKDPGHSIGLTAGEAATRLQQDGPNVLTPPPKKSALRKVCFTTFGPRVLAEPYYPVLQFLERLFTMFNILLMVAGVLEYILLGIDFKVCVWTDNERLLPLNTKFDRQILQIHTLGQS